jgi:hypothetical protein
MGASGTRIYSTGSAGARARLSERHGDADEQDGGHENETYFAHGSNSRKQRLKRHQGHSCSIEQPRSEAGGSCRREVCKEHSVSSRVPLNMGEAFSRAVESGDCRRYRH